jgi:RimJ/RimL family protein N-acetyltransferase
MKEITQTPQLKIAEANLADRTFFYELMNSPGWLKYIGDRGIHALVDAEAYIQNSLIASYEQNGFGLYKVSLKARASSIGICGFLQRDYLDAPDLGFAMLPAYSGHGYMQEAAASLIEHAQGTLGWTNIYAITLPGNQRSQRLLQKLGFEQKKIIQPEAETLILFEKFL